MKEIRVKALKVTQPIGDFYVAVFPSKNLCDITWVDIRTMVDDRLDRFMGIQREFSESRVKQIEKYITNDDATFPTSIVISIPDECAEWNESTGELIIREYIDDLDPKQSIEIDRVAKIIDGQHRVRGLRDSDTLGFEVHVSVFVGADEEVEATIFATVNLAQTKVNKSLVYDLFAFSKSRSPQRTCHDIAVILNQDSKSPLYHRIKRLGTSIPGREEWLTQATFVDSLLPLISTDVMKDRNKLRRNSLLDPPTTSERKAAPLRDLFVNSEDLSIAKNVWSFFAAVSERWPNAWENKQLMLARTNGFRALMKYFRSHMNSWRESEGGYDSVVLKSKIKNELDSIAIADDLFTTDNFKPGSSGSSRLYRSLEAGKLVE